MRYQPMQPHTPQSAPAPTTGTPNPRPAEGNHRPPSTETSGIADAIGGPTPVDKLSPEEQMALFEKELKEKDWGHQPC